MGMSPNHPKLKKTSNNNKQTEHTTHNINKLTSTALLPSSLYEKSYNYFGPDWTYRGGTNYDFSKPLIAICEVWYNCNC